MAKEEKIIFTDEQNNGGRGAWFLERFLFWGREANRSTIFLDRTVERINHIFVYLTWLLIFGGWLSFGWWVYLNVDSLIQDPWTILWFWKNFDPLIFFFLSTLWLDLFLFYRHCLKKDFSQRINYRRLDKKPSRHSRKKYNIAAGFSDEAIRLIDDAYILAARLKQPEVAVIHLFRSLLKSKDIQNLFIRLNTDAKRLIEMVDRRLVKPVKVTRQEGRRRFSGPTEEIFVQAFIDAYRLRQKSVDVFNLIAFCAQRDPYLEEILLELEIDQDKIKNVVAWFRVNRRLLDNYNNYRRLAILKPGGNMNRSYTAIATPTLERYARDLTVDAKYGALDICVGRDKEIEAIFEAFTGGHNGVLLVGQPGTGKSTIIGGLAQLMVAENVPIFLKDKRLLELDIPRLVSGASASEVSERLLICINEARRSGNIIFYIDNLENLLGSSSGANEGLNLSEVLAEAISRKSIFCLAAATKENYSRFIETEAIGDLMTTVGVSEPEVNEAIQMLESKVGFLEHKYDIYIVYSALEQAVVMSKHYINDKYLPLKAFNLLEKAVIGTSRNEKDGTTFCGGEQVAAAVSEITGIPLSKITTSEREKLLSLESEIHKRLIGQHEAVEAVSASLRRARAALKDSKRPIASFLFLGPTGVGKTELAKSVSQVYFGDEDYLVRIDMSEYQAADSIRKMIGDVDGTVGYLTEAVRKKPFSLVLFDEIEKANPDILNLFLQLLDDGRLTDGQGRTISFSESIIIATSNIGAVYIQDQIKAKVPINLLKQELIDNQLNQYLRPELINRFDGIIVFKPLAEEEIVSIAALLLKKIKKNLAEKGIGLKADKDGVAILAKEGFDPKFGARPLRRLLQDKVENDIANLLLTGKLKRRDTVIINSQAKIEIEKAVEL